MRLTSREKFIATATRPTYGGFATKKEVEAAKYKCRSHYWIDHDHCEYVAFSPGGARAFFGYDDNLSPHAVRRCAALWQKGCLKDANELYNSYWRKNTNNSMLHTKRLKKEII